MADCKNTTDYYSANTELKSLYRGKTVRVQSLPMEKRPREKILREGPEKLSDRELLCILLNTGIKGKSVNALAEELLKKQKQKNGIPSCTQLRNICGLGNTKIAAITAALEFGRRRWGQREIRIRSPEDIYNLIKHYADRRQERFLCISLNGAHEVLAVRVVTVGLVNKTIVHPREVFSDPIQDRASAICVAHNHPSGKLEPSGEDGEITRQLKDAADILGINFLDHIIFSIDGFYSFSRAGL
jgi:DNA repair protein RadC